MSKVLVTKSKLDSLVNAYNTLTGESDKLTLDQLATAISEIQTGGGDDPITNELERKKYSYTNNNVEIISSSTVFSDTNYVEKIAMNNLKRIQRQYIFMGCRSLTELHLPSLEEITAGGCIYNCPNLKTLELGPTLRIYYNASNTFAGIGVTSFTLPPCSGTGNMTWLPQNFLSSCLSLTYAKISEGWTRILQNAIKGNDALKTIDIPSTITEIGSNAMYQCPQLDTVICRATTVPTLSSGVFGGSKIASGTGYIYVPDDAVESYKTAANWSTYANQIKPLSEYTGD